MDLNFKKFHLKPFGSTSYIKVTESFKSLKLKEILNLYRSKHLTSFADDDEQFDKGLFAILDCLKQLELKIKSIDSKFKVPYHMNGHKLEDRITSYKYSVKCQFNSCEDWTKAMKFLLTNLKWCLTWITLNK